MIHNRGLILCLILGCFVALFLVCFGKAMRGDVQFGYRDAGHFYYPLYKKVQIEWQQGRWPLWEPEENSGMPLLGNPTAAVLYPGKLIYAVLPYPLAARVYIMAHVALAFVTMLITMRLWQVGWFGSGLAALSYAFGAPILFQYCNVIYLVGAAWLPLGFLALERWLRRSSYWAILGLAVVLSLQTLGGDPQAAYLLGLCGGGYAAGLAWSRSRSERRDTASQRVDEGRSEHRWWLLLLLVLGVAAWVAATMILAEVFPRHRPTGHPAPALPWMRYVPGVVLGGWTAMGLCLLLRWWVRGGKSRLGVMLGGLAGSAVLAAMLSAAQLLPVLEFTRQTVRAEGEGPHDIYPFSIEPFRLVELIWPNVLGTSFGRNAYWIDALRLPGLRQKIWAPSLYLGSLGLVLAAGAFTLRRGPAIRVWLSTIVIFSLLGSLGQYTSPIWGARMLARTTGVKIPDIGPLDTSEVTPIRLDRYLRDGDGGLYWWMTSMFPGFRQFRFPAKLFTFSAFGISALAGMGWELLRSGGYRRMLVVVIVLFVVSIGLFTFVLVAREPILAEFTARQVPSAFGPLDARAGFGELVGGLAHGGIMVALGLVLLPLTRKRELTGGVIAILAVTADLAIANARYVSVVPQSLFVGEPKIARIIREAEGRNASPAAFRVHRMPQWNPPSWFSESSANRVGDFVTWERATIQPKYGITEGIEYTHTLGVAEIYDYEWFFGGFPRSVWGQTAERLGVTPGERVVYFPRRSFDMWNTRYFVLPWHPGGWKDEFRGFASFLDDTEQIYPPPERFQGAGTSIEMRDWVEHHDYQIRRNRSAYPRAWVVHDALGLPPQEGLARAERSGPMQEMLYNADAIWNDPTLPIHDPHRVIWIDNDDRLPLREFLSGRSPQPSETVKVSYPRPDRAEINANLDSPGVVVLADAYYPGWKLTIDGTPAPIYRINRMMRGAAVARGHHRLTYTYEPRSFHLGGLVTLAGLAVFVLLAGFCAAWQGSRMLPAEPPADSTGANRQTSWSVPTAVVQSSASGSATSTDTPDPRSLPC
jgi:hypothetical protein